MDQAVLQTLTDTLSTDANTRIAAELQLKRLQTEAEYSISLSKLALTTECGTAQRHSAAVLLKSYIDLQWSVKSPKFRGPEPPAEAKAITRATIIRGLSDPISRIRVSCVGLSYMCRVMLYTESSPDLNLGHLPAYVVSKIAHLDWPDSWPELLDTLVHHLKSGSADEVHGTMRVLSEFVSKDITHVQMPSIAPVLFPELLRILTSEQLYSHATRSRCVMIFRHAVEMLYTIKEEHPDIINTYLRPIIKQWSDVFMAILNKWTPGNPETEVVEWGLKTEILKCINLTMQGFPKFMTPYLLPALSAVWQDMVYLRPRFLKENVAFNPDSSAYGIQDSDGDSIGFESYLNVQFEFFQAACHRRKLTQTVFLGVDGKSGILLELVYNLLSFIQMTDDQAELWDSDPNQFIADEEDESCSFNVRIAAQDLFQTLVGYYEDGTMTALGQCIMQEATLSLNEKAKGNRNWWRPLESCLVTVGLVSDILCDDFNSKKVSSIDVGTLFDHIVLANLSSHDFPFLQGRCFIFASQFAQILPSKLAAQYVSAAVEAIFKAPSPVVKVSSLKALNNFTQYMDKKYIAPFQRSIIQGVAPLIEITTEETLSLIFRTLILTSKIDERVTGEYESILGPLVLEAWAKYPAENSTSGDIMDFFDILAGNPFVHASLNERALPTLVQIIAIENPNRPMVSSAIDLLRSLIVGCPTSLPDGYVARFYPHLMSVLLNTEDRDILQRGQECLKALIQKDVGQVAGWRDAASGKTGLELLLMFIAKLLNPSQTESAALHVGGLISKLIRRGGDLDSSIIPGLLNAITARLVDAKLPSFIQPLIIVFAQLCLNQHEVVINFLSGIDINGRNGLEIVLSTWLTNHLDFQGHYYQKVSAVALTKVFMSEDPRVGAVQVRGDPIVSESTRVTTRSKAKMTPNQYKATTVPVKIIKLLSIDLTNKVEEEDAGTESSDFEGGDDEDDEVDYPAEGGSGTNTSRPNANKGGSDKYAHLSDLLDGADEEGDEDESDPDILSDPIYQLDIRLFLVEFFRQCIQQNSRAFVQCVTELSEVEKRTLQSLLEN
ncbi:hypothetical protein BGW38_009768 [Lunasporangiospora selenospora]|uniref:Importin N-terminal domain-containing protein n=1 Tax=Lunasporangiospora selenospora TaxID=979761 RepID=A0A9P6KFT8_9FUNG|nr:hypothetical protein BGW38_009768 [Lunasporangiospora selenospora]